MLVVLMELIGAAMGVMELIGAVMARVRHAEVTTQVAHMEVAAKVLHVEVPAVNVEMGLVGSGHPLIYHLYECMYMNE